MWLYGQYSYIYLQFFLKISHSGPYSYLGYITGIEIGFERNIVINIYKRIYSQKNIPYRPHKWVILLNYVWVTLQGISSYSGPVVIIISFQQFYFLQIWYLNF